jgi:hypothetical protein
MPQLLLERLELARCHAEGILEKPKGPELEDDDEANLLTRWELGRSKNQTSDRKGHLSALWKKKTI